MVRHINKEINRAANILIIVNRESSSSLFLSWQISTSAEPILTNVIYWRLATILKVLIHVLVTWVTAVMARIAAVSLMDCSLQLGVLTLCGENI